MKSDMETHTRTGPTTHILAFYKNHFLKSLGLKIRVFSKRTMALIKMCLVGSNLNAII